MRKLVQQIDSAVTIAPCRADQTENGASIRACQHSWYGTMKSVLFPSGYARIYAPVTASTSNFDLRTLIDSESN